MIPNRMRSWKIQYMYLLALTSDNQILINFGVTYFTVVQST